jgi:DNA repair ATPase RecN
MFRRISSNPAMIGDTYINLADMLDEIQQMVEKATDKLERQERDMHEILVQIPATRSLKKQIESDLYDMYQLTEQLQKKCINIEKLISKG